MEKIYCQFCGFQKLLKEDPHPDANGEGLYADLMCDKCHLIIASVKYEG